MGDCDTRFLAFSVQFFVSRGRHVGSDGIACIKCFEGIIARGEFADLGASAIVGASINITGYGVHHACAIKFYRMSTKN